MIVSDCSAALPEESKRLEDRLVYLYRLQAKASTDREWNLLNYLVRRARRPLYALLRAEYVRLWGKNASFSYFFPQHTFNAIARRAEDRLKSESA